jgi:hypothetical protein
MNPTISNLNDKESYDEISTPGIFKISNRRGKGESLLKFENEKFGRFDEF